MSDQEQASLQAELLDAISTFASRFEREFRISVDQLANTQLTIAVVGNISVGKTSIVNALFGKEDMAEVDALPGTTKKPEKYQLSENLFIADTPGLDDVDESLSNKTWEFVPNETDIVLFVLSAAEGLHRNERNAYMEFKKTDKPIVVILNKIDIVDPQSRIEPMKDDVAIKLGLPLGKVLGVSAKHRTHIEQLAEEIFRELETNKALLFLRFARDKERIIQSITLQFALAAAGVGVVPLPFSDLPFLTGLQMAVCIKIAHAYGIQVSKTDALRFIGSTVGVLGFAGRSMFRQIIKLIGGGTGVGVVVSSGIAAVVASGMTYGIGVAANKFYRSGMTLETSEIRAVFKKAYDGWNLDEARRTFGMLPSEKSGTDVQSSVATS